MSSDPGSFLEFLERQKPKYAARFPTLRVEQVLSFMGTTSIAGTHASCSIHSVRQIERGGAPRELRVSLRGNLPRPPTLGECLTIHMTRVERYQGFQVKTRALGPSGSLSEIAEPDREGITVRGEQIFTVHHSPYTLQFFETVPFDEVAETLAEVRFALVAAGGNANLSPRFIFHHEVKNGRLLLFHGDGLALKTYMNLRQNRCETRLVLDLDDYTGWAIRGTVEEFSPHQHPEAFERICEGFRVGGWGKPSRVFRFSAEAFDRISPQG